MSEIPDLCHSIGLWAPDIPMPWQSVASIWAGVALVAWAAVAIVYIARRR